jgi:hypothetical protein
MKASANFWRQLRISHSWVLASTEDGDRWARCSACGKDGPVPADPAGMAGWF